MAVKTVWPDILGVRVRSPDHAVLDLGLNCLGMEIAEQTVYSTKRELVLTHATCLQSVDETGRQGRGTRGGEGRGRGRGGDKERGRGGEERCGAIYIYTHITKWLSVWQEFG